MDAVNESREAVLNPTIPGFLAYFKLTQGITLKETDPQFADLKAAFWDEYLDALEITRLP